MDPNVSKAPAAFQGGDNPQSSHLVDRLDDSIGEASSGIGVILSELVRRTLRGGVRKIDEEMQAFVEEKVDDAVADKMPEFEDVATRTAESKAHDIASQAVGAVKQETRDTADRLAKLAQKSKGVVAHIESTLEELTAATRQLAEQSQARAAENAAEVTHLRRRVEELETQIAELIRPKGFSALWGKMFGKKKKAAPSTATGPSPVEPAPGDADPPAALEGPSQGDGEAGSPEV